MKTDRLQPVECILSIAVTYDKQQIEDTNLSVSDSGMYKTYFAVM